MASQLIRHAVASSSASARAGSGVSFCSAGTPTRIQRPHAAAAATTSVASSVLSLSRSAPSRTGPRRLSGSGARRWMATSGKGRKGATAALSSKRRKDPKPSGEGSAMGTAQSGLILDPHAPLTDGAATATNLGPQSLLRHDLSPYDLPPSFGASSSSSADPLSAFNPSAGHGLNTAGAAGHAPDLYAPDSGVSRADPGDVLDMGTMYDPSVHLPDKPDFNAPLSDGSRYEPATPLLEEIVALIGVRGPITVAEYMRMALRHPQHGYYAGIEKKAKEEEDDLFDDDEEEVDVFSDDAVDDDWDSDGKAASMEAPATGPGSSIIGPRGDFTTAPEISQIFGEMLAVWLLVQWRDLGKPSAVRMLEVGPGRGTLVCDVLRSACQLLDGDFVRALRRGNGGGGVHLVEVGRGMREEQREKLTKLHDSLSEQRATELEGDESKIGLKKQEGAGLKFAFGSLDGSEIVDDPMARELKERSRRHIQKMKEGGSPIAEALLRADAEANAPSSDGNTDSNSDDSSSAPRDDGDPDAIAVTWHDDLLSVPSGSPSNANGDGDSEPVPVFVICQELIDALPVHVFQKTEGGWRERLVDVAVREQEPEHVQKSSTAEEGAANGTGAPNFVPAKEASKADFSDPSGKRKVRPRLRYVLPPDATPAVRTLLNVDDSGQTTGPNAHLDDARPGDVLEVCPEGMMLAQDVATLITRSGGGAALLVDYGGEGSGDSVRAFKRHGQAHVLSEPGELDVTADVDFAALRGAVNDAPAGSSGRWRDGPKPDSTAEGAGEDEIADVAAAARAANSDPNPPQAFGPVAQGKFLAAMGATDRVVSLIERDGTTIEEANDLMQAYERLVTSEHMGERYKVMAIARKKEGIFPPPPF